MALVTDFTLSYSNSLALLNGSTNFLTPEGVGTFLLAASNGATAVNSAFGTDLTTTEVGMIALYLDYIASTFVLSVLPVPDLGDIGYFHWGSGAITSGDSLLDLDPTLLCEAGHFFPESCLPDYAEFWAWAEHVVGTPYSLTLENSKGLLTGDYYLGDAVSVGTLLELGALGQLDTINALFETDLNTTDLTMVMGYIQYMMTDFVAAWVLAPVFAADGDLVTERTVNEWLWDYDDPLLEFLKVQLDDDSIETANNLFTNHTDVTEAETGSPSTFMTGLDNIDEVGQYVKWRGNTTITVWNEDEVVRGTDASQFAPGVSSDDVLTAWVAELLRVVTFEYQEDAEIYDIDLLRFALADSVLASSTENPANAKYNQDLTGMANMEAAFGIPLFVSKPHFLDTESSVSAGITGLSPDAKLHDTFIDVEPTTGATMNAAKRLQISLFVETGDFFNTDVASSFIPLVWVEEGGSITEEAARDFIEAVIDNQNLGRQVNDIGPIVGGVMLIASAAIAVRGSKPKF
ncbi:MAG: CD36 family protein [Candidatus Heimdallarchaeota archaeon]|nr:CD36 family protein [Candidatus Heimdallarchaeota archaeon]